MTREKMVRRHISIPESLDEDMRNFIVENKHRSGKGAYSDLVIDAVRSFIDPGTHTSVLPQQRNLKSYRDEINDAIIGKIRVYLLENWYNEKDIDITEEHLDEAITAVIGVGDPRSIEAKKRKFVIAGYIQKVRFAGYYKSGFKYRFLRQADLWRPVENIKGDLVTQ
jgi:hypothetical protein